MPTDSQGPAAEPAASSLGARRSGRGWDVAAAVVIVFILATHVLWVRLEEALPMWDEAHYLLESVRMHQALVERGPAALVDAFSRSMGTKAPLVALLPLPSYAVVGEGTRAARAVNVALVALALWSVYRIGSRMAGPAAGLLAATFLGTFPYPAGLSRLLMVECLLTTLVVLWVRWLLRWRDGAEGAASWVLGVILGLGMLAKVTFPLYVAGPTLVVLGADVARHRRVRGALVASLVRVLAVGIPIAAVWYGRNWRTISTFAVQASFGRLARDYAKGGAQYWHGVLDDAIGAPAVLLAAALMALAAVMAARGRRVHWLAREDALLLVAWAALPAVVLGAAVSKDVRFTVSYLPAVALVLGAGWAAAVSGRGRAAMVAALVMASLGHLVWYSFVPAGAAASRGPLGFHVPSHDGLWIRAPHREAWPGERVVSALSADARSVGVERPRITVLFSHPSVNAHSLNYLAAVARSPAAFRTYHFQSTETPEQLARLTLDQVDYVITKSALLGGEALNRVNEAVRALLVEAGFPFVPVAVVPLPDGTTLTVARARRLWSGPATNDALAAVPLAAPPRAARFAGAIAPVSTKLSCAESGCRLRLAWRAAAPVREDYRVFVHVWDAAGAVVAIADYDPGSGARPTSLWRADEVVEDSIALPPLHDGRRLFVGWYRLEPRWRLPLSGSESAWPGEPNALELRPAP